MTIPLVSISCITYNHAPYIRECLEGFLMQKTNFPFEILIHDDASTDGTADIIREYEAKYPELIKPIFREKNLYSQGIRGMNRFNFERAQGKYIALCEGDDFWTDPNKLQIQFDFMESHPDYSMCFHLAKVFNDESGEYVITNFDRIKEREYTGEEILREWTVPTASVVFRAKFWKEIPQHKDFLCGDIVLFLTMSQCGKIYAMSRPMSVYRQTVAGVTAMLWWCTYDEVWLDRQLRHLDALYSFFTFLPKSLRRKKKMEVYCLYFQTVKAQYGIKTTIKKILKMNLLTQIAVFLKYLNIRFKNFFIRAEL